MNKLCVPAYKWARIVKDLAGNKCLVCGSSANLQAHHIMPRSKYPELANDLNNGLCLCRRCHYIYHNGKYDSNGTGWSGMQRPPKETIEAVEDFRDNCAFLIFPKGTNDRIKAQGFTINGYVNQLVKYDLERREHG